MPSFLDYLIAKLTGQCLIEYLDTEHPHLRAFTLSPGLIKN
jgi:hypothetical protein